MNRKDDIILCIVLVICAIAIFIFGYITGSHIEKIKKAQTDNPPSVTTNPDADQNTDDTTTLEVSIEPKPVTDKIKVIEVSDDTLYESKDINMSDADIDLIALVTMAEAEGECELGKRLVIDTILNRVDHDRFPNTVNDVIYQKNAFSSMWNGRVDRCTVRDDIRELVIEELAYRTNSDCVFFQMNQYSKYGTQLFKVGCHYFSSY